MRILLVEDDQMIGEAIRTSLRQLEYVVDWVRDGGLADSVLQTEHFDLVLLDLGLPGKDGIEVVRSLRLRKVSIPDIIITARDGIEDRIKGLDAGADDYVIKPFAIEELAARLRSALRRSSGHTEPAIQIGDVTINQATHEVMRNDVTVPLSAREYAMTRPFDAIGSPANLHFLLRYGDR